MNLISPETRQPVCTFVSFQALVFESHNLPSSKYWHKAECDVTWPFNVIQDRLFWDQWKDDEGLHVTIYNVGLISKVSKDNE